MKRKSIFLIFILVALIFLGVNNFKRYPKKIVAEVLYTIDDRIFAFADDYIEDFGISDIFEKVKSSGDYGIRLSSLKENGDKLNIINFQSVTNKSLYFLERKEEDKKTKTVGEKIVNSDVYLYRDEISDLPLYIDRNTMLNLSQDSNVLGDLGYDINNKKLFLPPVSFSEKNSELKKYVKKEWTRIIRKTNVKNISTNIYEIKVKSLDLEKLMNKVEEFYREENYFPFTILSEVLKKEFLNIYGDLEKQDVIVFYMETDDDKNLLKLQSDDGKYMLKIKKDFELKVPHRHIFIEHEENENLKTIKGKINQRNFRMSYYPKEKNLIYHDEFMHINARFYNLIKSKKFKVIADIDGSEIKKVNFNFYTTPNKIEKEKKYIEILKLSEKDWKNLIKGASNEK
ncbi:hypothetical protein HKO22_04730 [Peptoniphilus sp. AGMB00490]|uniref:DUF4340 domain-containing protein n=1 Tax=Peptoniphilus faecalis TaxID=2731255 RepID=A0A848R6Y6_9FIRM|nr:hypothetical protein [Peptoniphilus faecalis]NMW85047.1 hypothetical protein [Peptoniphilus faecalis]